MDHLSGAFLVVNDFMIIPYVKNGLVEIANCSVLSLETCPQLNFTEDPINPNYVVGPTSDFSGVIGGTCASFSLAPLVVTGSSVPNNTNAELNNVGFVWTESETFKVSVNYNQDEYFEIECSCASAGYVDIGYSLITNTSYLSLGSSDTYV